MANSMAMIVRERNPISLRTAFIDDDGNMVDVSLLPADLTMLVPKGRSRWAPRDFDWVTKDSAWMYRHQRTAAEEGKLLRRWPPVIEQDIKPMVFEKPPEVGLVWTDSGNGLAVYLNGEPWSFIDEETHEGYSKGVLTGKAGRIWDQSLFERIFP